MAHGSRDLSSSSPSGQCHTNKQGLKPAILHGVIQHRQFLSICLTFTFILVCLMFHDTKKEICTAPINFINGSFEDIVETEPDATPSLVDQESMPGWTVGGKKDSMIKVMTATMDFKAAGGIRFIELSDGYLYQDVVTDPGVLLYWRFSHRSTGGRHTVALNIGPGGRDSDNIGNFTADNKKWYLRNGLYTVPDGQHVTRMAFKAVGGLSSFIDEVKFEPPPCREEKPTTTTTVLPPAFTTTVGTTYEETTAPKTPLQTTCQASPSFINTGFEEPKNVIGAYYASKEETKGWRTSSTSEGGIALWESGYRGVHGAYGRQFIRVAIMETVYQDTFVSYPGTLFWVVKHKIRPNNLDGVRVRINDKEAEGKIMSDERDRGEWRTTGGTFLVDSPQKVRISLDNTYGYTPDTEAESRWGHHKDDSFVDEVTFGSFPCLVTTRKIEPSSELEVGDEATWTLHIENFGAFNAHEIAVTENFTTGHLEYIPNTLQVSRDGLSQSLTDTDDNDFGAFDPDENVVQFYPVALRPWRIVKQVSVSWKVRAIASGQYSHTSFATFSGYVSEGLKRMTSVSNTVHIRVREKRQNYAVSGA